MSTQRTRFEAAGQGHVLAHWESLGTAEQAAFEAQLERVDLELTRQLRERLAVESEEDSPALAPPEVFPATVSGERIAERDRAAARGAELLAAGRVGFVLVAGGQGSRLGFDGPKGAYEIGPVTSKSLFEWHAARIQAAGTRHGFQPRWYVMTSAANDAVTRAFFDVNGHFGFDPADVFLFQQDMLPALDGEGKIVLAAPGALFLAPNGHGGTLAALKSSGALADMAAHGIEQLSYFQVDNPLGRHADPLFIGLHDLAAAEMSSKVVAKRDAAEKVGVLGLLDGVLGCIEYSDLSDDLRHATDEGGALLFNAGNIAAHVIRRDFVEGLTEGGDLDLPWHVARKNLKCLSSDGQPVERPGVKFETFIFDALARTSASVVLEVLREEEFSPVKNAEGSDSPATTRADLTRIAAEISGAADAAVELDPRLAETPGEFTQRAPLADRTPNGVVFRPGQR
ncbi:UTP--glucose-1-phosphate uridylyltransferase [Planctomycetota bacterium]|nr:UTP--glucose-1-phosphate uridylyltransferase [Planctomycetota bacterium]